jgi:2-oxoglutarate dehydrogenase E1 component
MAVDSTTVQVVMPAMGDSVSEGTVLEWHKGVGDHVEVDETIVEISTDKVDAEVPSPVAGTIVKIHAGEGDTISVGAALADISTNGAAQPNGTAAPPTLPDDLGATPRLPSPRPRLPRRRSPARSPRPQARPPPNPRAVS